MISSVVFSLFNNQVFLNLLGVVLVVNIILKVFYKAFELKWPELYFSINDKTALFVSVSPLRFVAFRFLPVFVVNTFALSVFLRNYNLETNIYASLVALLVYSLVHDLRAIYRILTKSEKVKTYFNASFQILLHLMVILLLFLVGLASAYLVKFDTFPIRNIFPTFQGLIDNLWASLLAVLLAIYLREIYSAQGLSEDILYKRSLESIDPKIINIIKEESEKNRADPVLVKAVCIAENLQRPKWIRKIESIKGLLGIRGTYGIMQISAKGLISDAESVQRATQNYFANSSTVEDSDKKREIIKKYNNDERYIDIVMNIINFLGYYPTT